MDPAGTETARANCARCKRHTRTCTVHLHTVHCAAHTVRSSYASSVRLLGTFVRLPAGTHCSAPLHHCARAARGLPLSGASWTLVSWLRAFHLEKSGRSCSNCYVSANFVPDSISDATERPRRGRSVVPDWQSASEKGPGKR